MDAIRNSRKRNHRSSPVPGTLTRSRSQHLLHRNRSGHIRSDPVPRQEEPYSELVRFRGNGAKQESSDSEDTILIKDLCKKAKRNDGDLSRRLAKDLRARRVYSPQSSAGASSDLTESAFPKVNAVYSDQKIADIGFGDLGLGLASSAAISGMCVDDATMSARIGAAENPDLELSLDAWNFDRENTESSDQSGKLQDDMQNDGKNGGNCSEKIDDFGEQPVLTTPPDVVICGNSKVDGDMGNMEEDLCVKYTPFAGKAEANSGEGLSGKDGKRSGSVLRSKSVLRPRLPGKLFKAPGSVSYRRLFPFLSDIMGDDSDHCHKDEMGVDGQEFQLPLSSQGHEASKHELKNDSCTNESRLISSPMQLDAKEVAGQYFSMPYVDDNCASESKADPTTNFHGAKDVGNALHNDDFKQYTIHVNNLDCGKATNNGGSTSERFGILNEDHIQKTPDAKRYDNSVVTVDPSQSMPQDACHSKPMDLTISTQENTVEGFYLKADKRNDPLKSVYVPRPHLRGKLFKTPGSVSFRRLLPFLMDLSKDDSGTSKFGDQTHNKKDEADMSANGFQLPLPSQSEDAHINGQMTVNGPVHDIVESNALENYTLANPANELSRDSRPKLTFSQDITELPMQLDAKEVVHESLSAPPVKEHFEKVVTGSKDECASELEFDPSSTVVDFHCAKIDANAALNDGVNQIQNKTSRQYYSESPTKDQNMLYINDDVSNLASEHHSSKEKGLTIDYNEKKQLVNLEKHESVIRCPLEGQSLSQLDPNMLDLEENETSSHAISKIDSVVLNHVSVSSEEPRSPPSEKIISENQDMAAHGDDKAGSVLKGIVYSSRMPSKRSNNKNASCVGENENRSESKTALVLNRCPRIKLLKHAGSFNYKRLLPFFLNTMKYNSRASINAHYPKLQKLLDQTPRRPVSGSNLRGTPISDANDCVPMDRCTGNYGAQQVIGMKACDLNNDSSSQRSQIPEFQPSNDSVHRDLPITPLGPIIDDVITREEAMSDLAEPSVYSEATVKSSLPVSSDGEKPPETHGCQSLSQLKVPEQLRVPAFGFQKGILRRNPRGCRGLCTCLNCVSFRLHAERAFEFSRNQLLDAEEVAQDLMKELSDLRNMLERYTDSVNNNPVFDGSQVKEACRKAFETEQLANHRLCKMNDDLNIHCRIPSLQRPRVKFSDHVEEKVFQPGR